MTLLFDENLSRKLVQRLSDLFPGSSHVATVGLLQSSDIDVWEYARSHDTAIVTADGDFFDLAATYGPPPKVIWLRGCDYPTRTAEQLIRHNAIRIAEFLSDESQGVLIIDRQPRTR